MNRGLIIFTLGAIIFLFVMATFFSEKEEIIVIDNTQLELSGVIQKAEDWENVTGWVSEGGITWRFTYSELDELGATIEQIGDYEFRVIPFVHNESKVNEVGYRWKMEVDDGRSVNVVTRDRRKTDLADIYEFSVPKETGRFTLTIGEKSTQIDAAANGEATKVAGNENICRTPDGTMHISYIGGGLDLWYGNSTDNGTSWNTEELVAGTIENAGIVCQSDGYVMVYYVQSNDVSGKSSDDDFTTTDIMFDQASVYEHVSCAVDSDDDIHCCATDDNDEMWYANNTAWDTEVLIADSSDDVDGCDVEVGNNDIVYMIGIGTAQDDMDLWHSEDNFSTRNLVFAGGNCGGTDTGVSIAINDTDGIHIAFRDSEDLQYCHGNLSLGWTCQELDSSASYHPDVSITYDNDVYIMYASQNADDGDVFRANVSDAGVWQVRYQIPSQATSGYPSIAQSTYPEANYISDMLFLLYVYNAGLYIENFTVPLTLPSIDSCNYTGGNWNIVDNCNFTTNTTIQIDGNLTLGSGGSLFLNDTSIDFNGSNQYLIFTNTADTADKLKLIGTSRIN